MMSNDITSVSNAFEQGKLDCEKWLANYLKLINQFKFLDGQLILLLKKSIIIEKALRNDLLR